MNQQYFMYAGTNEARKINNKNVVNVEGVYEKFYCTMTAMAKATMSTTTTTDTTAIFLTSFREKNYFGFWCNVLVLPQTRTPFPYNNCSHLRIIWIINQYFAALEIFHPLSLSLSIGYVLHLCLRFSVRCFLIWLQSENFKKSPC